MADGQESAPGHEYAVLGDLRPAEDGRRDPSGWFVVRMFVGDRVYDEQIDVALADLDQVVTERMAALEREPDDALLVESERPDQHPGHAVAVPTP